MNNILLIVEGDKTEKKFFENFIKVYHPDSNIEIFPFCCDIVKLYKVVKDIGKDNEIIKKDAGDDEDDIEFIKELKNRVAKSREDKELLSHSFSLVFLVFDFDIHVRSKVDKNKMYKELLEYFDNPTNNGKIFINYPMMESYRHIVSFTDLTYLERVCKKSDSNRYKGIVSSEGNTLDINKYKLEDYLNVIGLNCLKALNILNAHVLTYNEFDLTVNQPNLLKSIYDYMDVSGNIKVLNSACLLLIYYFGNNLFKTVNDKIKIL